jgi:hypothetical protein
LNSWEFPSWSRLRDTVTDKLLEDDPRVKKLLLLALVTDSEDEAYSALDMARKLHAKQSSEEQRPLR